MMTRRSSMIQSVVAVAAMAMAMAAAAQEWPNKPIKFIWPYQSGSGNGEVARLMMEEVGKVLGQKVITDYRPGAGGRFGVAEVAKERRNDYLVTSAQDVILTTLPSFSPTFKAQPGKDYRPVAMTHQAGMILTSHPGLPFRDLKGMIEYAKANPGKLSFGSSGIGGTSHLLSERIFAAAGVKANHIPYRGSAQALTDRLSGRVDVYLAAADTAKQYTDNGQLVALAVTGPVREAGFPNTATLKEAGLDVSVVTWGGIVMPAETPDAVIQKLNKAINEVLARAETKKLYEGIGYQAAGSTAAEMDNRIKADTAVYVPIIKQLNIELE